MSDEMAKDLTISALRLALQRAVREILRVNHAAYGHRKNEEAVHLLAMADQQVGQKWDDAIEVARTKIASGQRIWP